MFSQHPSMDKSMRPIYGSVMEDGVNGQTFAKSSQYGDVGLVLKKDVNARTTFTSRDSLAVGTQPSPILQPNKSSYFPPNIGRAYTEAQIHGQVKLSDIAYIVTDSSKISSELQQNLKKAGVPVVDAKDFYGYKWQVEETGDMTKAQGRLIAVRGFEQKLFYTHDEVSKPFGMTMRMGFIENADGRRFDVNVDSALARGYWTDPDATVSKSLIDLLKASFAGDRSAAGRYAANMRWQGQRQIGFIGKSKFKLGSDGSIHPRALQDEILEEASSFTEVQQTINIDEIWKKIVTKNVTSAMSDVSATEIAETVLESLLMPRDYEMAEKMGATEEQMRTVQKISQSTKPQVFHITQYGDIVTERFGQVTEKQWVEGGGTSEQYQNLLKGSNQYTYPSPDAEQALKEVGVKTLIQSWAQSSNDDVDLSLAIQDASQKVFKTDWAVSWSRDQYSSGTGQAKDNTTYDPSTRLGNDKVLQSFVKAQYEATQQYLAAKGIKEITLFRGMKTPPLTSPYEDDEQNSERTEILMRPLSSWSTSADEANFFAGRELGDGVVIKARFKAKDIFALPLTGVGCLMEFEVVVNSGSVMGSVRTPFNPISPAASQGAEKLKRVNERAEFNSWADANETGENPRAPIFAVTDVAND
jgi:hypothetical protein